MSAVYVLDTMALTNPILTTLDESGAEYIVVEAVDHESKNSTQRKNINKKFIQRITKEHLIKIQTICPELVDRKLLSLSGGEGDVNIAAECLLEDDQRSLFGQDKVVITDDKTLTRYCADNGISVIKTENALTHIRINQ